MHLLSFFLLLSSFSLKTRIVTKAVYGHGKAASHLVPTTFKLQTFGPPKTPKTTLPAHLVPLDK